VSVVSPLLLYQRVCFCANLLWFDLDVRQTLWGSQKCYTAQELKTLINRVRTQQPTLHLPLVVIPETDGLRQRVQELLEAEAAAEGRQEGQE
jgi:hypothetical protein